MSETNVMRYFGEKTSQVGGSNPGSSNLHVEVSQVLNSNLFQCVNVCCVVKLKAL